MFLKISYIRVMWNYLNENMLNLHINNIQTNDDDEGLLHAVKNMVS